MSGAGTNGTGEAGEPNGERYGTVDDTAAILPPVEAEPAVKIYGSTPAEIWARRALILSTYATFTVPYFQILNTLEVEGREVLDRLPDQGVVFLSNHQTYVCEAIAFYHLVYFRFGKPLERPFVRFSAAEETMKHNLVTVILTAAGGVTFRRSFRERGRDVNRPVDLEGVAKVEAAIRQGWLLHFPAGTTKKGAPLRRGVAQILHRTRCVAVPMRIDGFRDLLVHKQVPGRVGNRLRVKLFPPMDLVEFYLKPYRKEAGVEVVKELTRLIGDPEDAPPADEE